MNLLILRMYLILTWNRSPLCCINVTHEISLRYLDKIIILERMSFCFLRTNLVEELIELIWKELSYLIIVKASFFFPSFTYCTHAPFHAAEPINWEKNKNTSTYLNIDRMSRPYRLGIFKFYQGTKLRIVVLDYDFPVLSKLYLRMKSAYTDISDSDLCWLTSSLNYLWYSKQTYHLDFPLLVKVNYVNSLRCCIGYAL